MRKVLGALILVALLVAIPLSSQAQSDDVVTVRLLIFEDGNSVDVLEGILVDFEAENPDIIIELDVVPESLYSEINTIILEQIEAGIAPDLVRVTDLGRFSEYYLDVRPYLSNADEWDENFAPELLAALRVDPDSDGLYGYPTDFTISAPFINRTLFEAAGVDIPSDSSDEVTWAEWEAATRAVQDALSTDETPIYGMMMDRSGHRFWGPSLSLCATYLNDDGSITVDTEGFRAAATMLYDWHTSGLTALDVWAAAGEQYIDPGDLFEAGQAAFHFSGSWKVSAYQNIDDFEWEVVPNPVGDCGSTGMVGGGVMVAMQGTAPPEAVGRVMSYLTQEETLERFYGDALFLPGHRALIENGVDFASNTEALNTFAAELGKVLPEAYELQYLPESGQIHSAIRVGLLQVMSEALTLDEAIEMIQADIDTALSE